MSVIWQQMCENNARIFLECAVATKHEEITLDPKIKKFKSHSTGHIMDIKPGYVAVLNSTMENDDSGSIKVKDFKDLYKLYEAREDRLDHFTLEPIKIVKPSITEKKAA
jgi:hypothetical protein